MAAFFLGMDVFRFNAIAKQDVIEPLGKFIKSIFALPALIHGLQCLLFLDAVGSSLWSTEFSVNMPQELSL